MRNFLGTLTICALLASSSFFLTSCGGWNPAPSREIPTGGVERAKKNVKEGKGISLGALGRGETNTNYQFSTSNPMWRAAFDVIDFMPLVTVDYSGGTIITDWYTDKRAPSESLKFTIRFKGRELQHSHLGNELMAKIKEDMKDIGKVELQPKFDGKQMIMVIQPL